jgi:hypothetical protein
MQKLMWLPIAGSNTIEFLACGTLREVSILAEHFVVFALNRGLISVSQDSPKVRDCGTAAMVQIRANQLRRKFFLKVLKVSEHRT